jgi:hypothetical protein
VKGLCNAFDLATFSFRFRGPLRQVAGQIGAVVLRRNIQVGNKLRGDSDHCAKLQDWHSGPPRNLFSERFYKRVAKPREGKAEVRERWMRLRMLLGATRHPSGKHRKGKRYP